jgi:ABC-type branched-subunit amino acid transport system permease subunit
LRVRGLYLALSTLALQFVMDWTIAHVPAISGGTQATLQSPELRVSVGSLSGTWGDSTVRSTITLMTAAPGICSPARVFPDLSDFGGSHIGDNFIA